MDIEYGVIIPEENRNDKFVLTQFFDSYGADLKREESEPVDGRPGLRFFVYKNCRKFTVKLKNKRKSLDITKKCGELISISAPA